MRIERTAHRLLELEGKSLGGELFTATVDEAVAAIHKAENIALGLEPAPPPRPKKQLATPFSMRLEPEMKEDLQRFAQEDRRSLSNFVETELRRLVAERKQREKRK